MSEGRSKVQRESPTPRRAGDRIRSASRQTFEGGGDARGSPTCTRTGRSAGTRPCSSGSRTARGGRRRSDTAACRHWRLPRLHPWLGPLAPSTPPLPAVLRAGPVAAWTTRSASRALWRLTVRTQLLAQPLRQLSKRPGSLAKTSILLLQLGDAISEALDYARRLGALRNAIGRRRGARILRRSLAHGHITSPATLKSSRRAAGDHQAILQPDVAAGGAAEIRAPPGRLDAVHRPACTPSAREVDICGCLHVNTTGRRRQ